MTALSHSPFGHSLRSCPRTLVGIWSSCFAAACNTPYSARFSPRFIVHRTRSARIPRTRGQLLGGVTASLPCRGRWMRAKRADGGVAAWLLLFTSTPQSIRLAAYCQLPGRGVFGRYTQTLVQSRRAANDGPYSTSYKPLAKSRGRTASTISSQSLTLTRRKADFTLRKQYFTARQRNFTRS